MFSTALNRAMPTSALSASSGARVCVPYSGAYRQFHCCRCQDRCSCGFRRRQASRCHEPSVVGCGEVNVQIRVGYELVYQCRQPTPMILNLNIHYTRAADLIRGDDMCTDPWVPLTLYRDGFGNWCTRLVAPPGRTRISADAAINDRGLAEPVVQHAQQHPVELLPEETLVYLLASRYCDTENLAA